MDDLDTPVARVFLIDDEALGILDLEVEGRDFSTKAKVSKFDLPRMMDIVLNAASRRLQRDIQDPKQVVIDDYTQGVILNAGGCLEGYPLTSELEAGRFKPAK